MLSNLPITIFTAHQKNVQVASLRSKRFRLISEQKKTKERDFRFWPREKWNESQKLIFRAAFDSRSSFFAPKPHGNACYAGYRVANEEWNLSTLGVYRKIKLTFLFPRA